MTQRGPYLNHLWDAIEDNDVSLFIHGETIRGLNAFSRGHTMSTTLSTTKIYSIKVLMPQELRPLLAYDRATFVRDRSWIFKREKGREIVFQLIA